METITDYRFYGYAETNNIITQLVDKYGDFLTKLPVGVSVCGRKIYCLKLGNSRESMLYVASVHGNEYITTSVLLRFIEDMCYHLSIESEFCGINMNRALITRSLYFVPMLNPDGCEIALKGTDDPNLAELCGGDFGSWKANGRGVDINHNFDADWEKLKKIELSHGISSPTFGKYGGEYPCSEPETVAICTLCRLIKPRHVIALHTQGEEIYYGYRSKNADEKRMAEIFAMTCGYTLSQPDYLSSCGGFKDWFCKTFHRPGFTFECGRGVNPLPQKDILPIYKKIRETLGIAAII